MRYSFSLVAVATSALLVPAAFASPIDPVDGPMTDYTTKIITDYKTIVYTDTEALKSTTSSHSISVPVGTGRLPTVNLTPTGTTLRHVEPLGTGGAHTKNLVPTRSPTHNSSAVSGTDATTTFHHPIPLGTGDAQLHYPSGTLKIDGAGGATKDNCTETPLATGTGHIVIGPIKPTGTGNLGLGSLTKHSSISSTKLHTEDDTTKTTVLGAQGTGNLNKAYKIFPTGHSTVSDKSKAHSTVEGAHGTGIPSLPHKILPTGALPVTDDPKTKTTLAQPKGTGDSYGYGSPYESSSSYKILPTGSSHARNETKIETRFRTVVETRTETTALAKSTDTTLTKVFLPTGIAATAGIYGQY